MNNSNSILDFLSPQTPTLSIDQTIIGLLISLLLSYLLGLVYVRFGDALSNRQLFARNFIPLAMTTTLVITIVKSSLALSLGLVGALSIVRFRSAIKEPEELAYLFLCIAIGLGLGANQFFLTIVAFAVIMLSIMGLKRFLYKSKITENLYLTINHKQAAIPLETITGVLNKFCTAVSLKRYDHSEEGLEATFMITFDLPERLTTLQNELQQLDKNIAISFVGSKDIA